MRYMCFGSLNKVNDRWNSRFYCWFSACLHISFFRSSPTGLSLACSYFAHTLHFSSNTSKQLVSHCHPKTTNIWGWNRETAIGNTYSAGFGAVLLKHKYLNIPGFVNVDGESFRNVKVLFSENTFQNFWRYILFYNFFKYMYYNTLEKSVETINLLDFM